MKDIERDIIEKAMRGDKGAFSKIHNWYGEYLWALTFRTIGSYDADEVYQTLWIKVYEKMRGYRFKAAFSTWLYKVSWSVMMDYIRKRKRRNELFVYGEDYSQRESHLEKDYSDSVEMILSKLTHEERFLLMTKEVEGMPFETISYMTGKKEGALRTALSRIKNRIREELGDEIW